MFAFRNVYLCYINTRQKVNMYVQYIQMYKMHVYTLRTSKYSNTYEIRPVHGIAIT